MVELEDIEELRFTLDEDWNDILGKGYLTKEDQYNSLFELADIWTPEAEKDEYYHNSKMLDSERI